MYCINCGKQIENESKFCKYCGSTQNMGYMGNKKSDCHSWDNNMTTESSARFKYNFSALDICIGILYIILVIRWIITLLENIKETWNIFDFVEPDMRLLLLIVYMLPFAIAILLCIVGFYNVKNQEYHISLGILLALFGFFMKIGTAIIDRFSANTLDIVAYQIFSVYGSIGIFTIILSVMITIILYSKASSNR